MNNTPRKYPSNRKFGLFFSFLFFGLAAYFKLNEENFYWILVFVSIGSLVGFVALIRPNTLEFLKVNWMRLGDIMGQIVSPVILGIIFYLLITPIGLISRIFGRDELRLKKSTVNTYWIDRDQSSNNQSFKNQF